MEAERDLGIVTDPGHWTYKIPGVIAWSIVILSVVGIWAYPLVLLWLVKVFATYLLIRFVINVTFYVVGIFQMRRFALKPNEEREEFVGSDGLREGEVRHVVILPTYKEPMDVLRRTLSALAGQRDARRRLFVVLAMEERELGALAKARKLRTEFRDRFADVLITLHPANLPGEIAGKGSNQAWAARQVKRRLVDIRGISIDTLTVSSCDADSIFHPGYFAELGRQFVTSSHRYRRFWQAPVSFHNNIWQVPIPTRLLSFSASALHVGTLVNPWSWRMPYSTYSLSLRLADEVGYWDPAVIAEDWHMYLRSFFAKRGRIKVDSILLPTSANAMEGDGWLNSLINFYRQQLRHAWGARDVGYIAQQMGRFPDISLWKRAALFFRVQHDHQLWSTAWFLIILGSVVSTLHGQPVLTYFQSSEQVLLAALIQGLNFLGMAATVAIWIGECFRCPVEHPKDWPLVWLQQAVAFSLLPFITLTFLTLPGLHAQTKMLFGQQLTFWRAPKGLLTRERGVFVKNLLARFRDI